MSDLRAPEPGDLRHRVTLQSPTVVQDARKDLSYTWTPVGTYWASIRPASGTERTIASQTKAEVSHVFALRYQPGVTIDPTMRFTYASRTFNVTSVLNTDERSFWLVVYCLEVVA